MKRILLVSYYYPPYPYGGSLRFKMFFEMLKKNDYDVRLVTSGDKDYYDSESKILYIKDSFRRERIDMRGSILRALNPLPDTMLLWSKNAVRAMGREYDALDSIIITAPPFSLPLLLASRFSKEKLSKVVLDIRDLLYDGALRDYRLLYPKLADRYFEKLIFSKFTRFTTNVENHCRIIKKRYDIEAKLVMNSSDDYTPKLMELKHPAFVYAGKIDKLRFNKEFFKGFEIYSEKNPGFLYIAGEDKSNLLPKQNPRIIYLGQIARERAEDLIYSSDACVMMHDFNIRDRESVFSYKITDYSKHKKPVIYSGPVTAASKFIDSEHIGITINMREPRLIAEALKNILSFKPNDVSRIFKSSFEEIIS
ncbi:MAG: hypothetical protein AB7T10_01040 [bacterium]